MGVVELYSGNHGISEITSNKMQHPEVILHAYR
jgi:hypothetical protein